MPNIELPDELWNEIIAQQARLNIPTQSDLLTFYLEIAQNRYWPAVGATVTRNNAEILLVDPNDVPKIYLSTPEGVRKVK